MARGPSPSARRFSPARAVAVAIAAPAIATSLALLLQREEVRPAASIYMLAVVAAAAFGGSWSGIAAAALGFLAQNFFLTEPTHTLRVQNSEDLIALLAFLVAALIVGSLLARMIRERDRASRRERETRLLNYLAPKLLSAESLDRLLGDFATALLEPFGLQRCDIRAGVDGRPIEASAERPEGKDGPSSVVRIVAGSEEYGTLTAVRPDGSEALSPADLQLLDACGRQVAVAIERERLDARVERARVEAETSQRRELLRTVLEETGRLDRLVSNILELAKVRAGALVPAKEPTAIDEVVDAVLHRMGPRLAHVRVRTIFRPDLPEVPVDPVQLDQVLTNLLENAVRFSPSDGEILISVAPWQQAVQVRVADQGPGIPPEDQERVFEAFYRRDGADGRSGSGLGLAIARAIVLAHGGRIWIEGAPSGGTAVVFELPITDAEPVSQEPG